MSIKLDLNYIRGVQVFACASLFILIFMSSCESDTKINQQTDSHFSIKPLSKFHHSETFKINNTVIVHDEEYLFKTSNSDTIWIPSTRYTMYLDSSGSVNQYLEQMPNTGIISILGTKLMENNVCKVTNLATIAVQGQLDMEGKVTIAADESYLNKITFFLTKKN